MLDPSSFKTEPLQRIAEYWLGKRQPGRLPGRPDIKPEELRRNLPYIYLVDIGTDPLNFRFRLVGTRISIWSGHDYTGVSINEAEYGPRWRRIFEDYRSIMETREPTRAELYGPWPTREHYYYERFLAPLAADGSTVDMILGALCAISAPD